MILTPNILSHLKAGDVVDRCRLSVSNRTSVYPVLKDIDRDDTTLHNRLLHTMYPCQRYTSLADGSNNKSLS